MTQMAASARESHMSGASAMSGSQNRHPLLPMLTEDETILEEVAIEAKLNAMNAHKMNACFMFHK